jgi:hypothetical protein
MTKNKGGRPRIKIDWHIVNSLCEIWCTGEEIAHVLGCSYKTLNRACKHEFKQGFGEYYKKGSLAGKTSLRRLQWKSAEKGSVSMLIWLGKQYLGQKDKPVDSGSNELDAKFLADLLNGLPN